MYATYVDHGGSSRVKRGALALDFPILFLEACLFVALAALIETASAFTTILIVLLVVDCLWGFLSWLAFTGAQAQSAERTWSVINLIAAVALCLLTLFGPHVFGGWGTEMKQCVLLVCIVRTIADYAYSWSFYYPDK